MRLLSPQKLEKIGGGGIIYREWMCCFGMRSEKMKWYWKCMLSVAACVGIFACLVKSISAQSVVADTVENNAVSVVDPVNAVIATAVILGIGVLVYVRRHSHHRQMKRKKD